MFDPAPIDLTTATITSIGVDDRFPISNIIDDDPTTFFKNYDPKQPLWVKIYLGSAHKIGLVEVTNRKTTTGWDCNSGCVQGLRNTKVEVENADGATVSCGVITGW